MRSSRFLQAFTAALAVAACSRNSEGVGPTGGHFTLTRTSRQAARTLAVAPASASWCAADSSLVVVVVTSRGDGGTAARLHWPLKSLDTFKVGLRLGATGSATVAWRPIQDTVRTALIADSGQLRLQTIESSYVSGSFTAWARGVGMDTGLARLDGKLDRIPVVARCGDTR